MSGIDQSGTLAERAAEVIEARGRIAFRIDQVSILRRRGIDPELDATVASWVLHAPWAHPLWPHYWLYVCHLRPMPDDRPTKFYLPGATHELWLYACDPRHEVLRALEEGAPRLLVPKNFAAQIIMESDEAAAVLARDTALDVLCGALNPDTDNRRAWALRFGANMLKGGVAR